MFLPYIDMNQPPSWTSIPLPSPSHPSGVSQHTGFECPVSWIDVWFSGHDSLIWPRDQTCVSQVSCVGGGFFTTAPPGMHPLIPLLDSYPRQRKTYLHTKTCMKIFRAALSILLPMWKTLRCPITGQWSGLSICCCCCSANQVCLTLCDPLDCSMPPTPSVPVPHHLAEFAQADVHGTGDAV